jgi:hypothetical protein
MPMLRTYVQKLLGRISGDKAAGVDDGQRKLQPDQSTKNLPGFLD